MTRHGTHNGRTPVWLAGLVVAVGAGVATAHGLYEVAIAARVPAGIAWLYPLITDGLALVAYAATARLVDAGRRYAWTVVVLAAGLSGLAQAAYLAGGVGTAAAAPTVLRFGVGAWPAIAAAVVAHLLHLLGPTALTPASQSGVQSARAGCTTDEQLVPPVQPPAYNIGTAPIEQPAVQPAVQSAVRPAVHRDEHPRGQPVQPTEPRTAAPARDRARTAAHGHQARHGRLPTVTELTELAKVARGTAATVLKELRTERPALQIVRSTPETSTDQ